jgi:hypothetical protein
MQVSDHSNSRRDERRLDTYNGSERFGRSSDDESHGWRELLLALRSEDDSLEPSKRERCTISMLARPMRGGPMRM